MSEPDRVYADRYHLQEVLGVGTTATVYLTLDSRLGLTRAVKVLSPRLSHLEAMRNRFEREAQTTRALEHPNIVRIHDFGTDHGDFFIVMDHIQGGTLRDILNASGPLPPRKAAALLQQVLHAVQYAHAQGVVHRDIKPRNIMVSGSGTPLLTDFGIARIVDDDATVTRPGAVMGTWGYMAPEQRIDSGQVDNRTDVYAMGATLFTLLTGQPPPERFDEPADMVWANQVPRALARVIRDATRYNPEDRYPTAARMAEGLAKAHKKLRAEKPEEEATIMVERINSDRQVQARQLDFSDLEKREAEAKARRDARRNRLDERRAPTSPEPIPTSSKSSLPMIIGMVGVGVVVAVVVLTWLS